MVENLIDEEMDIIKNLKIDDEEIRKTTAIKEEAEKYKKGLARKNQMVRELQKQIEKLNRQLGLNSGKLVEPK